MTATKPATAAKGRPGAGRRRRSVEPRSRQINVRVSDAEWEAIDTAAETSGLSRGAFVAETVQASIERQRDPLASVELRRAQADLMTVRAELARVGNNLNQIARRANEGELVPGLVEDLRGELVTTMGQVAEASAAGL